MNNDDGASARSHPATELRRVDIVGGGINVREYRLGAQCTYGTAGGHKGERRKNHFVANADAAGAQGENESIGAGTYADTVRNTAKARDLFFQRSAFAPQDKLLRSEHALDRVANFPANDSELRGQIKLRDRTVGCREWISAVRCHWRGNSRRGRAR